MALTRPSVRASARTLYFAYGSNMDVAAMAARCPGAAFVGTARVDGHAFRVNRNHHATILPAAGKVVHGVLWTITDADQALLDEYEGVAISLYRRHEVQAQHPDGRVEAAMTYMARNTEPTLTGGPYFDALLAAARRVGLPSDYVLELETWRSEGGWGGRNSGTLGR